VTVKTLIETSDFKPVRLKILRPTYELLVVADEVVDYFTSTGAIRSSSDINTLSASLRRESREYFVGYHLDSKNKVLCVDPISIGSLNASIVHPREVFKSCLLSSCAGLVLVHNHPSGDPTPSREDHEITTRLKECSELLGIRLLDHVIIGDPSYYSFADQNLL